MQCKCAILILSENSKCLLGDDGFVLRGEFPAELLVQGLHSVERVVHQLVVKYIRVLQAALFHVLRRVRQKPLGQRGDLVAEGRVVPRLHLVIN